jgi:hypothetical protein
MVRNIYPNGAMILSTWLSRDLLDAAVDRDVTDAAVTALAEAAFLRRAFLVLAKCGIFPHCAFVNTILQPAASLSRVRYPRAEVARNAGISPDQLKTAVRVHMR